MLRVLLILWVMTIPLTKGYAQTTPGIVSEEANIIDESGDVLLIDNSKTKVGRDFYEQIYRNWQNAVSDTTEINIPKYLSVISTDLVIVIDEAPGMGSSSIVSISVDDIIIWRQQLQPKADLVEILAEHAILYITDYILNYSEYMEQLKNEDQHGTF